MNHVAADDGVPQPGAVSSALRPVPPCRPRAGPRSGVGAHVQHQRRAYVAVISFFDGRRDFRKARLVVLKYMLIFF